MAQPEISIVADPAALAAEAAKRIAIACRESIAACGDFTIALSGGNTPRAVFELLSEEPWQSQIDWSKWEVFFGDERCVPPEHADSNYRMASESLLCSVPIAGEKIHRMRGELAPAEAAKEYGQMLKQRFGDGGLDLVMLGMGDDGHTASLFPGTAALAETHHRCVANYVEKLKAWRITMSAPFINRSARVMILAAGAGKSARLHEVLKGPRDPQRLPIQMIAPAGRLWWILDRAAAAEIGD
jgi:6-phosphogluconolactonase